MKNIDCNVYKDFLPLYVDGIVSDETKEFVEKHLLECEVCRREVERLSQPMEVPAACSENVLEKIKKKLSMKNTLIRGMALLVAAVCLVMAFSQNDTIMRSAVENVMDGQGIDFHTAMYFLPLIIGGFLMEWWFVNLKKMWGLSLVPLLWSGVLLCWAEDLAAEYDLAAGIFGGILWMIGLPLLLGSCLAAFLKPKPIWKNSKMMKFLVILSAIVIQIIGFVRIFWLIR